VKSFIHSIIETAQSPVYGHNLRFLTIDKKNSLFVEIHDQTELYNKVSQLLRDQRKRSRIENHLVEETKNSCNIGQQQQQHHQQQRQRQQHRRGDGAFLFDGDNGGAGAGDGSSIMGFDAAKRLKGSSTTFCKC